MLQKISDTEYFKDDGCLSNSMLSTFKASHKKFYEKYIAKSFTEKPKASYEIGKLLHCLLLEPDQFELRYSVFQGTKPNSALKQSLCDCLVDLCFRRGIRIVDELSIIDISFNEITILEIQSGYKPCKGKRVYDFLADDESIKWLNSAINKKPNTIAISNDDYSLAVQMRDAILNSTNFNYHFGECELVAYYEIEGLPFKSKYDCIIGDTLIDIKTTSDINTVIEITEKYGYLRQMALYYDSLKLIGREINKVVMVFVEKQAPFAVKQINLSQHALSNGRAEYTALIAKYKECLESGKWDMADEIEI